MQPIVTPAEMREIDANAAVPFDELIARAGWFVARRARSMLGGVYGRRVTVIAGPGNNGADARVAAALLSSWGVRVTVLAPDAGATPKADLIIDGAFGTGMNRAYEPSWSHGDTPVLAIDIPSGVCGLTGERIGSPQRAAHTVTFAAHKPGLLLPPGSELAGDVEIADIGLDTSSARAWLFTQADAARLLPQRSAVDHKWKRSTWVIGGSQGMYGAPLLASRAALHSGSGMVWCSLPGQTAPAIATEVVFQEVPGDQWADHVIDASQRFGSLIVGPGLGRTDRARSNLHTLIESTTMPMVLDADALHLIKGGPPLRPNIVVTPHDGEFKALIGAGPSLDRFEAARTLAASLNATVLLKGPLTIVAEPGGHCYASAAGDQRLATAGTGDVLSGVIGSYLAAGLAPSQAGVLGAWMHGQAGRLQKPVGMVASDLFSGLGQVAERLVGPAGQKEAHAPN